jgi:subtilisin family serine protease
MSRRLALALAGLALAVPPVATGLGSFAPTDPLASKQWYLGSIHAFDTWPELPATLAPVRVAVIDSGLDLGHPEFAGTVVDAQSFVGGDVTDRQGHGTFVTGIIAAALDNGQGIAGIAFPAELLIAKVVRSDGTISPVAEAKAIRWAVDNGAQVINLSLGGLRDPRDSKRDTYSPLERNAVDYAYSQGAVLVAAVGNGDEAPQMPWDFASYPASLPHVIGVSALTSDGSVPVFSNRDQNFNDISAPGVGIVSTLPRSITATRPICPEQGYSLCGPLGFRQGEGTSYAAAQVSAAAALLLATKPTLTPDQVSWVLERSARDVSAATGCPRCLLQRDQYSGWGELDVAAALKALNNPLPPPDRYEGNDDAGHAATSLFGRSIDVAATLDFWDDQVDVYRVRLLRGQTVAVSLRGPPGTDANLVLWRPGTHHVEGLSPRLQSRRLTQSTRSGPNQHLLHRAREEGWFYVEVKLATPGGGEYHLHISKSPIQAP